MSTDRLPIKDLILVPAVISLVVTLLRLTGELQGWAPLLFSAEAGGGGALVGISWLIPIFGIYFAVKLARSGNVSVGLGKAIGVPVLVLAVAMAVLFVAASFIDPNSLWTLALITVVSIAAIYGLSKGWPELFSVLLAYALAARIPVAIVMFFAIMGSWGTHYDVVPSDFPAMGWFSKWIVIGLVPQLTVWIALTLIVGGLFGGITLAVVGRRASPVEA